MVRKYLATDFLKMWAVMGNGHFAKGLKFCLRLEQRKKHSSKQAGRNKSEYSKAHVLLSCLSFYVLITFILGINLE
jgi:hypothetical protein